MSMESQLQGAGYAQCRVLGDFDVPKVTSQVSMESLLQGADYAHSVVF